MRWYYFQKMQMDDVLLFKQFDSDTAFPGRMTFHTAFVDPTVRPDAPVRQSIECRAFLFFPDFEPNTCPALPSDAVAREVASHAEGDMEPLEGPRVVRVDAGRRVLRSACRTRVHDLGCAVR